MLMDKCNVDDSFPSTYIDKDLCTSCAIPSVWYICTFAMLITISIVRFWFTRWFYRCGKPSKASHRVYLLVYLQLWNLENTNILKTPTCFWGQKDIGNHGAIVGNETLRTILDKFAVVCNWPLSKTQKRIKSFVQFCSYYGKFIHHVFDCAAALILVLQQL